MPNPTAPATISGRIDYVMAACKYPSQKAFADAIGESSQVVTNWRNRGSIGRAGPKLRAVTGVSTDWMQAGVGEPFPDGPVPYSGPIPTDAETLERVQNGLDDIGLAIIALCRTISARSQDEARELSERLAAALEEVELSGKKAPFLRNLRDKAALPSHHTRPHPHGKRG